MAPQETPPIISATEELEVHPSTNLGARRRVRSLSVATVVSSVQDRPEEHGSPKSDVRSVFSSISQKSLRSGISVSLLKKMAKIGSTRDPNTEDPEVDSVPTTEQRTTSPSEKPLAPVVIQIAPKILGGIICEHMFDDETLRSKRSDKSVDVGYIRMLKPETKHLVKSRPLLDTPIRVESEEEGVEVVQKNKFIVWDKETTLEVTVPASKCEGKKGYELVVEVGVVHNDVTNPLGTAIISLKEGELEKMRFLLCPKPLQQSSRQSKRARQVAEQKTKYRLDSSAAFAVEVQVTDENAACRSSASIHDVDSPLSAKVLLSGLAARFGANGPMPSAYATGLVEEIKEMRSSPRSANASPVGFGRAPFSDKGANAEDTATEGSASEEEENRLPFVEMTSFSLETKSTDEGAGLEAQNCLLFVGQIETFESISSSDNDSSSGSSTATGKCSAFSGSSSVANLSVEDKELANIMKKRDSLNQPKAKATRNTSMPNLGSLKLGPSSPRTGTRKKSLKDKLRRVLDFNNRGAAKLASRGTDRSNRHESEANSILDVDLASASSLKFFKTTTDDFAAQTCCSPFQNGGPITACSRYMSVSPERDGIRLSRSKVTKLAKSLQISPSTLVHKIEQLDE